MRLADIQFTARENTLIARVSGEIELANADSIRTAIVDAVANDSAAVVLDVTDVDYLDSAGIQLVYKLRESLRARGQPLRLVVPRSSTVHDALRLAGVADHIETIETVDQALRAPTSSAHPEAR